MRQTFLVELEWLAGDTLYSEGDLLEQLRTVFGREYDNEIYSVKEVLPKVEPLEMPVVPSEVWGSLSQADGYAERESSTLTAFRTVPKDVTWIGEIDGKRYSGLGKPESGWAVTHMWRLWFDGVAPSDTPKSLRRTVIDWLMAL